MAVNVNRGEFASAVAWVSRAVPARPALPILAGIKMHADGEVLTVNAFDNDQSATATVPCTVDEPFTAIVSGRLLHDLSKAVAADTVTMEMDQSRVRLSSGRSKFNLPQMPLGDYPDIPNVPDSIGQMTSLDFSMAVRQVTTAAGKDETLPALTGVHMSFDAEAGEVTLASTDRYRLAVVTAPYVPAAASDGAPATFLVPSRALDGYAKTLPDGHAVTLRHGDGLFGVSSGGRAAGTRMLDGQFPAFERLLPTEFTGEVKADVAELTAAVRRVALVADRNSAVLFSFTEGQVEITVKGASDAQAAEVVDVEYAGDDLAIAFNPSYFVDGLAALHADSVRVQVTEANRPALLVPGDGGTAVKYLLMPVRSAS